MPVNRVNATFTPARIKPGASTVILENLPCRIGLKAEQAKHIEFRRKEPLPRHYSHRNRHSSPPASCRALTPSSMKAAMPQVTEPFPLMMVVTHWPVTTLLNLPS